MRASLFLLTVLLWVSYAFAQTSDSSLSELMDDYLSKREQYKSSSTKKISETKQAELDAILDKIKLKNSTSFEYHLITYINGNYNLDLKDHLLSAYSLNPENKHVQFEMLAYYVLTDNTTKKKEFIQKISKYYTGYELAYYKDALPTISNAVLITSGQDDLFGFLIAQQTEKMSSDIKIINLDLLQNDTYRTTVSTLAGIKNTAFIGNESSYITTLVFGTSKEVLISCTVPQSYLSGLSDNLWVTGLNYQFGTVNQEKLLEEFWNNIKAKSSTAFSVTKSTEKKLYSNYLPPLLTLYKIKKNSKRDDVTLKNTIQNIAEKIGKKDVVDEILSNYEK